MTSASPVKCTSSVIWTVISYGFPKNLEAWHVNGVVTFQMEGTFLYYFVMRVTIPAHMGLHDTINSDKPGPEGPVGLTLGSIK